MVGRGVLDVGAIARTGSVYGGTVRGRCGPALVNSVRYSWSRSASYSHTRRGFITDFIPLWQLASCKCLFSFSHGAREASRWSRKGRIGDSGLDQKCRVAA